MADDSILSLLSPADLAGFNQQVTQSDPFMIAGNSLASWQPNYSFMNATESGLTSFGKAFAQGLLQNYGQNRASEQLGSVINVLPQLSKDPLGTPIPEGVDSSPFNLIRGSAYLNKVKRDEAAAAEGNKTFNDLMATVIGEGVKNRTIDPAKALVAAKSGNLESLLSDMGLTTSQDVSAVQPEIVDSPLASGRASTSQKLKAYYSDYLKSGMPPVQAASAAKQQIEGELKANNQSFDEAKAAREAAQKLFSLANTAEAGMSSAGQTGSQLASGYEKLVSTLAPILPGSQEEAKRQAEGDALLSSIAPDLLVASRPPGVGAMSDPEMRVYLSTGPSPDKTPEQNAVLIEKMKNVAKLNSDYADFLDAYRDANSGSTTGASQKWAQYTQAYPIFKGGEMDTSRPSWQEYFSAVGSGQDPNAVALEGSIQAGQQAAPQLTQETYNQLRAQGLSKEQIKAKFGM